MQAAAGFGLFYLLVGNATEQLVGPLASIFPELVPELFMTAMAAVLWMMLSINVFTEATRQLSPNPRRFDNRQALEPFLDRNRPSRMEYLSTWCS